jgi:hypothetical protein
MAANASCRTALLALALAAAGCGPRLVEHVSEEGRFGVLLPGEPSGQEDEELAKGQHKVAYVERSGNYTVAWLDLPDQKKTADEVLDNACDGALKNLQAKAVSRKEITLEGTYPGRDLAAAWSRGFFHARFYLVGRRLYHVVISGEKWWVESARSRKVLESFRVVEE